MSSCRYWPRCWSRVCTFEAVRYAVTDPGLRTLIAPLVTLLPGAALTTVTVELASGEMVARASAWCPARSAAGRSTVPWARGGRPANASPAAGDVPSRRRLLWWRQR